MKHPRKLYLLVAALMLLPGLLAACGENTATTAPATTSVATTTGAATTSATTAATTTQSATTTAAAVTTTSSAATTNAATAAPTTQAGAARSGGTFRWRQASEPKTLDPDFLTDQTSIEIAQNIFEGLLELDPKLQPKPALASAMPTVSDDGKTYTFKLKPGLKFSNGDPLTAKDFVYGWNRVAQLGDLAQYASVMYEIEGFEAVSTEKDDAKRHAAIVPGIKAVDDNTIEIKLNGPSFYFLTEATLWTFYPVNQKLVESKGDKFEEKNTWSTEAANLAGVSTGPFMLKEWKHDVAIRLELNPNYSGPKPDIDAVTVDFIKEDATARLKFDNGELDEVLVPVSDIQKLKKDPKYQNQYHEYANLRTTWLQFNFSKTDNPLSTNSKLRQAFAYAMDRQLITDGALNGSGVPTTVLIPEGLVGYKKLDSYPYNKDKAVQMLKEAGYDSPDKVKQLEDLINNYGGGKSGGYAFNADTDQWKAVAENVQQQLKTTLGLNIKLNPIATFKEFLARRDDNKEFIFMRGSWGADYPDPQNFYELNFASYSGNNKSNYKSPAFDELVKKGNVATTPAQRAEFYQQAEKVMQDDVAYIPLFNGIQVRLQKPSIQNFGWTAQIILPFKYAVIKK